MPVYLGKKCFWDLAVDTSLSQEGLGGSKFPYSNLHLPLTFPIRKVEGSSVGDGMKSERVYLPRHIWCFEDEKGHPLVEGRR